MAAPGMMPQGLEQQSEFHGVYPGYQIQHLISRKLQEQQEQNPPFRDGRGRFRCWRVPWVVSLRQIQPDVDIQQSIAVVLTYESKVFQASPDQIHDAYDRACKGKLTDIAETRACLARVSATSLQQYSQNPQPPLIRMAQLQIQLQGMKPFL